MPGLSQILLAVEGFRISDLLPAFGICLIVMGLMVSYRKRRRKSMAPQVTPDEQVERVRQQKGMRADLEDLMVEIEQLARRFGSQLDAKTIALEQVIKTADAKIERLERLIKQAKETSTASSNQPVQSENADPVAATIYELADDGMEPVDIAAKIDEHIGKVELILALREAS